MFLKKTFLGWLLFILIISLGGIGSRIPERQSMETAASQGQSQSLALSVLNAPRVRHALIRVRSGVRRRVRWIRRFVPPVVRSQIRHNLVGFLHGTAVAVPRQRGPIPPDGNDPRRKIRDSRRTRKA